MNEAPFFFYLPLGMVFLLWMSALFKEVAYTDWMGLVLAAVYLFLTMTGQGHWISPAGLLILSLLFAYLFLKPGLDISRDLFALGVVLTASPAQLVAGDFILPYAHLGYGLMLFAMWFLAAPAKGIPLILCAAAILLSPLSRFTPLTQFFSLLFWMVLSLRLMLFHQHAGSRTLALAGFLASWISAVFLVLALAVPAPWILVYEGAFLSVRLLVLLPLYTARELYSADLSGESGLSR